MKRKLLIALTILLCFCSLTVLTSCSVILDLIFGPLPSDTDDNNVHVHTMTPQTYTGTNCSEQEETISYFKCSECNKCYLDEAGTQLFDEASLSTGHKYVYKYTDDNHYLECDLCHTEQQDSRQPHSSETWFYTSTEHHQVCDVCDQEFNNGTHDPNADCDVCGRQADYTTICNSNYGYDQLEEDFPTRYVNMRKLYNKLDQEVKAAHDNANRDFSLEEITADNYQPALSLNCTAYSLTINEICAVVATYRHDHPLYYWLLAHIGYMDNKFTGYTTTINICVNSDYAKGADRVAMNADVYKAIDKYLSYVSDMTDPYKITKTLHNKIIANIDYAYQKDGQAEKADWAHNVDGVFVKKSAVCDGYAKAFQLLLNACGIDNLYVNGYVHNEPTEGHAWNLVQLDDDRWYWYDLTWDDQPKVIGGVIYDYFCKPNNDFVDHTVNTNETGIDYLYGLPDVSNSAYQTKGSGLFPFLP